ncbi:MAG: cyclic di-GMP phosphodiesterase [Solirubrobacteraceae bacterium]|jgi:putative two-component system response regulator|nr:cyclic di-GMP phosphodiesterase [Solirubrobacteraceae bacterium]
MSRLAASVRAIFEDNREDFLRRVATLEQAVAAIAAGNLNEPLRATAESDAHKLAGSLGTFGLPRGSAIASQLELWLAPDHEPGERDETHLARMVTELRRELEPEIDPPAATFEAGLASNGPLVPAAGRILVVDDDMPVREVLAAILSDAGYDVRHVASAKEARHALAHEEIALLLSDVSMPDETGLDLIRFALCEYPQTATLLISGLEDPGIAQVAMDFGAYGYLSKPVRRSAVLIGVMNALRRRDMEVRERDARANLEHVVAQRTGALSRALDELERANTRSGVLQAEAIHRWAQAAEYRDPGVGQHLRRMSAYCGSLAQRFELPAESIELASVLHDVGKVAISDSILLKPGPLTAAQRLQIEMHAEIGFGMLRGSCSEMLDLAALIAWTHHEKFDGSGYPRGLAGDDIPLEGRIAAVADVFDALTSDRVYRQAWSVDETLAEMASQRAKHFDPDVLDAFLSSIEDILAIRSALADA